MTSENLQQQKAAARDKRRYVRMTLDGASCICTPDEVKDIVTGDDIEGATYENVWMTKEEYEALPEFESVPTPYSTLTTDTTGERHGDRSRCSYLADPERPNDRGDRPRLQSG